MQVPVSGPAVRPRAHGRGWGAVALSVLTLLVTAGCTRAPVPVAVPTFPAAPPATTTAPVAATQATGLPLDCEELIGHDELPALFGLPEGSVTVGTVLGQPAPAVGRRQRVDCTYTAADPAGAQRSVALRVTVGLYQDGTAARDQHERNVADLEAGAAGSLRPELGDVAATMVQRTGEDVLLTSYGALTLDLDLPHEPHPLAPVDLLTDLARRILARLEPTTSPGADHSAP